MKNQRIVNDNLSAALKHFQNNHFDDAQNILSKITSLKKPPALACFLNAVIFTQKFNTKNAIIEFKKSIAMQPDYPDAHNNLGVILQAEGNLAEAKKHYLLAVKQKPNYTNALFNLGNLHHINGDLEKAENYYLKAIKENKNYLRPYNNLGVLYRDKQQLDKSHQYFQDALTIDKNDHEVLNNIGSLYSISEESDKALSYYQCALERAPDNGEILNNIGIEFQKLQLYDEAEAYLNRAIQLKINDVSTLTNLGNLYKETNRNSLAKSYYQKVLEINPLSALANNNYGVMLYREGNYTEAIKHYESAIVGDKTYREAKYNLATTQLASGNFKSGWADYSYRPSIKHRLAKDVSLVDIHVLSNKHILILNEQGIGDELFFLRFAKILRKVCKKITYIASPKMATFAREFSFLDHVATNECECLNYDLAISVADIPTILAETKTATPIKLSIESSYINELKDILKKLGPPPYIAITWRAGIGGDKRTLFKSIPISQILDSIKNIDATFISIQRSPELKELAEIGTHQPQRTLSDMSYLNDNLPKMLTFLSLIDDYIGVSNTNMHLSLAIGKTAKVLIPHPPEWRWMLKGNESPWFSGFELFRQTPDNHWSNALSQLNERLISQYGRSH